MDIVTAEQMQNLDRQTIQEIGIPGAVLMENAGRGTVEQMRRYFPDLGSRRVVVIAGKGNNGGDGFVIARYLLNQNIAVNVFLLAQADRVSGDAALNLAAFQRLGGLIQEIPDESAWRKAQPELKSAGLIVDALFGTGLQAPITGLAAQVITEVNQSGVPVVAVDVPSGLDATSGQVQGCAIKAQLTCTFGLAKRGLVIYPGLLYAGKVEIIDIGIPCALIRRANLQEHLLEDADFYGKLPARAPDSHKGTYGHAFIIAGSPGKTGAAALAAQAAMRVGAGLVTIGVPEQVNPILEIKVTEAMTEPLPGSEKGYLGSRSLQRIQDVLPGKTVMAIGPGIADRAETAQLVHALIESVELPLVIDADGLNAVARNPEVLKKARAAVVLTPHPGEMARLMHTTTGAVQADRIGSARTFAAAYGVIVVLKGARTVIAEPGGQIFINPTGNPGMASGGMGDVLTGMIAGFMAQRINPLFSAQCAAYVHGRIGDTLAARRGNTGIIATDIIDDIPAALQQLTGGQRSG